MTKGLIGAIIGLFVGWVLASLLQRVMGGIGVHGLLVILVVIGAGILGWIFAGLVGAVVGAIAGAVLGALAVGFFFTFLKLALMVIGAVVGWQVGTASDEPATA
jgi:hypothetical protein